MRVIGVGNILLCDEGIGVHVVRMTPDELAVSGASAWSLHDLNLEIAAFAASPRP